MSIGVLRRAHLTLVGSALGGVLAIVNEVLCARYMGVNAYGLYALALIMARVSESTSILGLPVGTLHHVAIYRDRGDERLVLGTILASLWAPLVAGSSLGLLLWMLAPWLAAEGFGNLAAVPYIRAMAAAVPFMGLSEVLAVITRGYGHAGYYVVVRNLIPPVVFMALVVSIAQSGAPSTAVPVAFAVAYGIAAAAGVYAMLHVTGRGLFRVKPAWPFRPLYAYSLPVLVNTLLYLVVACTSILALGLLHTDREVGIFRACMQIVIPFDMVVIAFNASVGNLYPVLAANGRGEELAPLVQKITRWMSTLSLFMLLLIAFNRHDLIGLMGPDFVAGGDTLLMLALGHAMLCSIGSAGYLLVMSGRQHDETVNAGITAVVCVALNVALVPSHGTLGAAFATALSLLVISILRVVRVRQANGFLVVTGAFGRILAAAGLAAAVLFVLTRLPVLAEGGGLALLALRCLLVATVFGALYWLVALDARDRRDVRESFKRYLAPKDAP